MKELIQLRDGSFVRQLPDGSLVRIQAEPLYETPSVYQQEYQQYPRPSRQRRRRRRSRIEPHPVTKFVGLLVVGFCAIVIHPVLGLLLWGAGIVILVSDSLKRN